jgi:hypothetical protein
MAAAVPDANDDRSVAVRVAELVVPVASRGVRSYVATALAMSGVTLLVAAGCGALAASAGWVRAAVAVAIALVAGTVAGVSLAAERAVAAAVVAGIEQTALGSRMARLLFARLLRVDAAKLHGERGVAAAVRAERLPLAQAEAQLRAAVDALITEPDGQTGPRAWLARRLRAALLGRIEGVTLARFRQQGQEHGGVDLVMVQTELAATIDARLVEHFESASRRLTLLAVGLFAAGSIGAALALRLVGAA